MRGERLNPFGIDWRNFVVAEVDEPVVGCVQLRPADARRSSSARWWSAGRSAQRGLGAKLSMRRWPGRRAGGCSSSPRPRAAYFARWGFRAVRLAGAPWPVRRNWLLGQAGSLVALAHGMRPQRLAILERVGGT